MKQTVIMSPYKNGFSGMAEFKEGFLSITLNHPELMNGEIFRVYLLSTSRAMAVPYFAGDFECGMHSSEITLSVCAEELVRYGYSLDNTDTCVITAYDGKNEEAVSAAFFGLEWNAARFLSKKGRDTNENIAETFYDSTLSDAQKLIDDMKKGKETDDGTLKKIISSYVLNLKKHHLFKEMSDGDFEWYKIPANCSVTDLSAVGHILSGRYAESALKEAGYYIAGVCRTDNSHIAVGIPSCRRICPMPQLSDCCGFTDGFHIVGIFLSKEGQYFEKYLKNNQI